MAKIKISALPETASLQTTDLLTAVANSTSSKVTVKNLANSLTQVTSSISSSYAANGGVTSIIAGSSISVDTSTGNVTVSYAGGGGAFPYTGSAGITGSLDVVGPVKVTGSVDASVSLRTVNGIFIKTSGGTYNNYLALDGNDNLSIPSYGSTPYGIKIVDSGGNLFANFLGSATPQFVFTGSAKINGDLNVVNGGVTGSLFGTSSWALNVVGGLGSVFPYTGSAIISGSLEITGSVKATQGGFTGSLFGTSSYVTGSLFSSTNPALSSSYALSSSFSSTSSLSSTSSYINTLVQNVLITGSLVVSGSNGAGIFSQGATLIDYIDGISNSGSYMVWRAPFSCSVVALYGYYLGGTAPQVNAARSGSSGYGRITGSNITFPSANAWTAATASGLQNTQFNAGDSLQVIMSGSANNQLAVQVDFIRKF